MKQLLLFTILTFVLASSSQAAPGKKGDKPEKCSEDKVEAKCKDKAGFDKFEKHHKDLICQLKKMRDTAVKENATQTVKLIDELVDKTQKQFHEKAKLLQEKMHKKEGLKKATKSKSCPSDCIKSCCAAKKKAGTCPRLKEAEACPPKCPKASEEKKAKTCSKTKA